MRTLWVLICNVTSVTSKTYSEQVVQFKLFEICVLYDIPKKTYSG